MLKFLVWIRIQRQLSHSHSRAHTYTHTHARVEWPISAAALECTFLLLFLFSIHFVLGVCVCTPVVNGFGYQSKSPTNIHTQSTSFCKQTACSILYSLSVSCSVYFSVSLTCFSHANKNSIGVCSEFAALFCRFSRSPKKTADVAFVYNLTAAESQTC